jgi:hypothetical protein
MVWTTASTAGIGWDGDGDGTGFSSMKESARATGHAGLVCMMCLYVPSVVFVVPNSPSATGQKKDETADCDRLPMLSPASHRSKVAET